MASFDHLSDQDLLAIVGHGSSAPTAGPSRPQADHVHHYSEAELRNATAQFGQRGPSDAELLAMVRNNRSMGAVEDAGRSFVTGAEKGVTGLFGLPATIQHGSEWLQDKAEDAVLSATGRPALTDAQRAHRQQLHAETHPLGYAPSQGDADKVVQDAAGPYHHPQYATGRFAETAGEFLPAALAPGGAFARLARVAVPALSAQTASEIAPEKYKGLAKVVGGLAGGGTEALGEAVLASPHTVMADAMRGLTEDQLGQVQTLRQEAAARGVNLTLPEAVQQVTNSGTTLGRVQRIVESSGRTAPRMAEYFSERPDQVRGAVEDFATGIAPGMDPRPGMVAAGAQEGAQKTLDFVRKSINEAADPSYQALRGQTIAPDQFKALAADPAFQIALKDVRGDPILNHPVAGLPDNDLAVLNEVVKRLGRNADASRMTATNPSGDNQIAAAFGNAKTRATALAEALSGDWRMAHGTVAAGSRAFLDPLEAGPLGKIAGTDSLPTQTGALYPRNPPVGAPGETADALGALSGQEGGRDLAAALTRHHVQDTFNQSARDLSSGPNQYAGALFARDLLGNSEQGAALHAGLNALDPNGGLSDELNSLADILQATGRRERPGSMTAFNLQDEKALNLAPTAVRVLGGIGDPLEWTKLISNATGGALGKRKLDVLADLLTDPDTAEVLRQLRSVNPGRASAVTVLPAIDQSQGAGQQ